MTLPASLPGPDPEALSDLELATFVVGKLCHDVVSPAGAIVSGLDLLNDPGAQDMREDAIGLIQSSADKLVALVHFARVAFGAATSSERFDPAQLETLAQGVFQSLRAELSWDCRVESLGKPQARVALNLAQIAGGMLAHGGTATVTIAPSEPGWLSLTGLAQGQRVRLKTEAELGLKGQRLTEGLAGQWIQPFWLARSVAEAGGTLSVETGEDQICVRITLPA